MNLTPGSPTSFRLIDRVACSVLGVHLSGCDGNVTADTPDTVIMDIRVHEDGTVAQNISDEAALFGRVNAEV